MIDTERVFILECEIGHRCISIQIAKIIDDGKPSFCAKCKNPVYVNWDLTYEFRKEIEVCGGDIAATHPIITRMMHEH